MRGLISQIFRLRQRLGNKPIRFCSSSSKMMSVAWASPNRGSDINMAKSSNDEPNSPHDATEVWVSMLHHNMRKSRSIGFLSIAIDLAWMINFMSWLKRSFIPGWASIYPTHLSKASASGFWIWTWYCRKKLLLSQFSSLGQAWEESSILHHHHYCGTAAERFGSLLALHLRKSLGSGTRIYGSLQQALQSPIPEIILHDHVARPGMPWVGQERTTNQDQWGGSSSS